MRIGIWVVFILIFSPLSLSAVEIPLMELSDERSVFFTEGKIGTFVDESRFMSVDQLVQPDHVGSFRVIEDGQLNFGYSSAAIWCQVQLKNTSGGNWFLKLGYPIIDFVDVYLVDGENSISTLVKAGSMRPANNLTYCLSGFLFKLPLEKGKVYRVFIRLQSKNLIIPMIELGTRDYFYSQELPEIFLSGAFYGLMFGLVLYSCFLIFFKQTKFAIFYALYMICFSFFDLLLNGYLLNFFSEIPRIYLNYWVLFSLASVQVCLMYFIKFFIDSRFYSKFDKVLLKVPLYGILFLSLTCWVIDFEVLIGFAWLLGFVFPFFISFYISIKSYKEGFEPAKFIFIGNTILLASLILFLASISGFIEYSKTITHITHAAIGGQCLLFGLALYSKQIWSNPNVSGARLEVIKKVRENQTLQTELNKQQMQLYNAVLQAQERERSRIAKDLHDGVGQTLAAVKMIYSQLIYSVPELENHQSAQNSMQLIDNACNEIRQISHQMMPVNLLKFGLKDSLEELFEKTFKGTSIALEYQFTGLKARYTDNLEIGIYRILQEIISNIIRHSGCSKAFIDVIENDGRLMVIAEDNGKGFEYIEDGLKGAGLDNIKFRVHALSGTLAIETRPQKGCVYQINIPLNKR